MYWPVGSHHGVTQPHSRGPKRQEDACGSQSTLPPTVSTATAAKKMLLGVIPSCPCPHTALCVLECFPNHTCSGVCRDCIQCQSRLVGDDTPNTANEKINGADSGIFSSSFLSLVRSRRRNNCFCIEGRNPRERDTWRRGTQKICIWNSFLFPKDANTTEATEPRPI